MTPERRRVTLDARTDRLYARRRGWSADGMRGTYEYTFLRLGVALHDAGRVVAADIRRILAAMRETVR